MGDKAAIIAPMTTIERADLESCHGVSGAAVVIDVIRAFTTAAYAFGAGAALITPVGTVEQALALRERLPGALAIGEERGLMPAGFDFGNSPAALLGRDLRGRRVIQRTSLGTQGLVRSTKASLILAASFANAAATARYLRRLAPASVTLVPTGLPPEGAEDHACADYLEALLLGRLPDPAPFLERARLSYAGRMFYDPEVRRPGFDPADLECCLALDQFDFALVVSRDGAPEAPLTMRAVSC
jgi:2-phosphosulfolactate phosphatase